MNDKTFRDREILNAAQERGPISTLGAFFRLSGPGWLQSAITLGGGSLGGALYLGMLGGTNMLWLQLVAITIGVIMLSAISYVTLSTGKRPYAAINEYVNPVLGVGWITATILANMIWILPQFSLCYDALDKTLFPGSFEFDNNKAIVSAGIAMVALFIVLASFRPGWMSKMFDLFLKGVVGVVVICFVAVAYKLFSSGQADFGQILMGFIPDFTQWNNPSPSVSGLLAEAGDYAGFWKEKIVKEQQSIMIGVTATAVGLNMTFLLPYSMLARGWDKPFRGLAKFDLITGMAIPYLIVTSCIVLAAAFAFHAKADPGLLSSDPKEVASSTMFGKTMGIFEDRYAKENGDDAKTELNKEVARLKSLLDDDSLTDEKKASLTAELQSAEATKKDALAKFVAGLPEAEKKLAPTLVKPDTKQLAATLAPIFGEGDDGKRWADLVFGIGALAMGFSTIIILSLINGYAFGEIFNAYENVYVRSFGAIAALAVGFCWFIIWESGSKTWLIIVASTFGAILLPIAYIAFFALMNNRELLGEDKPTGIRMSIWNLLMCIGVLGAIAQAVGGTVVRMQNPQTGAFVIGGVCVFLLLAVVGFSAKFRRYGDE